MYNKKEQKNHLEYLEHPEQLEGFNAIPVPENLDGRIEAGIADGKRRSRRRTIKKAAKAGMGMAAAVALASVLCMSNPSFAAKMPLIGHIFERLEARTSVKGDFSKVAESLTERTTDGTSVGNGRETEGTVPENAAYTKTSNGITMTLSEVYYNQNAIYIAMSLHSEEPFPENVKWLKNCEDYILDYEAVAIEGNQKFSYRDKNDVLFDYMEGNFVDDNTIAGILRIDLREQSVVPDTFRYDMDIARIRFSCIDGGGEDSSYILEGNWNFRLDVTLDTEDTQTVEINEVNENGIGLEKVVKTRYEMNIYTIDEDGDPDKLYFAEVFDANGEKMDYAGNYADNRQTYGYDTSKVNIYICDYDEYMNELKGYYWSDDYEEKKKAKTYEQYIAEHALYHKEIVFDR